MYPCLDLTTQPREVLNDDDKEHQTIRQYTIVLPIHPIQFVMELIKLPIRYVTLWEDVVTATVTIECYCHINTMMDVVSITKNSSYCPLTTGCKWIRCFRQMETVPTTSAYQM